MNIISPIDYPVCNSKIQLEKLIAAKNAGILRNITQLRDTFVSNLTQKNQLVFSFHSAIIANASKYASALATLILAIENPSYAKHATNFFGLSKASLPVLEWKTVFHGNPQKSIKMSNLSGLLNVDRSITLYILGIAHLNAANCLMRGMQEPDEKTFQTVIQHCCNAAGIFHFAYNNQPGTFTAEALNQYRLVEIDANMNRAMQDVSLMYGQMIGIELARMKNTSSSLLTKLCVGVVDQSERALKYFQLTAMDNNILLLNVRCIRTIYGAIALKERGEEAWEKEKWGEAVAYLTQARNGLQELTPVLQTNPVNSLRTIIDRDVPAILKLAKTYIGENDTIYFSPTPPLATLPIIHGVLVKDMNKYVNEALYTLAELDEVCK